MNILELSNKTNISYSTLHKIVNSNSNTTIETLSIIAEVFDLEVYEIISPCISLASNTKPRAVSLSLISFNEIYNNNRGISNYIREYIDVPISSAAFATNNENLLFSELPSNTILLFDKIFQPLTEYSGKFVVTCYNDNKPALKKLIIDGKDIFLEDINQKAPYRKALPKEQIEYYLFCIKANF